MEIGGTLSPFVSSVPEQPHIPSTQLVSCDFSYVRPHHLSTTPTYFRYYPRSAPLGRIGGSFAGTTYPSGFQLDTSCSSLVSFRLIACELGIEQKYIDEVERGMGRLWYNQRECLA